MHSDTSVAMSRPPRAFYLRRTALSNVGFLNTLGDPSILGGSGGGVAHLQIQALVS
jgi:hypothetical protein